MATNLTRLGDWITYTAVLRRTWLPEPDDLTTWLPVPTTPRRGLIVGRRTLATGRVIEEQDWDEWNQKSFTCRRWERRGSVAAFLVAYDMSRAPVYVPPGAVWYVPVESVTRILVPRLAP